MRTYSTPLPNLFYIPNDHYLNDDPNWREGTWAQPYPDMWGLQKIQAVEAWNVFDANENGIFDEGENNPGEGVVVAVIDTGVDYNHPDLADNIWVNSAELDGTPDNDDDSNGYVDDIRGWDIVGPSYTSPVSDNDPMDDNGHGTHCAGTIAAVGNNTIGMIGVAPGSEIMVLKGLDSQGINYDIDIAECIIYAVDK
ncbi:MAG: Cell wall/surface repeat protein [Parcubacteria group bacterium GW2011_GWA2_46_7]|nr:MAG: Cell wall/surface repeat protein [Parcubacteria group bacterium GW2011_GWA2_46_7]